MPHFKIKSFCSRYTVLIKAIDFFSINLACLTYLKLFAERPYISAAEIGVLYSLLFILSGSQYRLYTQQLKKFSFRRVMVLFFCAATSGLLSLSFYIIAQISLHDRSQFEIISLATGLTKCSVLIVFLLVIVRIVAARLLLNKPLNVAILGITRSGLEIDQALRKDYLNQRVSIRYFDDRVAARDSRFVNIKKEGTSTDLLALAKTGEIDEIYIALPMIAQARIRRFLDKYSDSTVDVFLVPDLMSYSAHISQVRMFDNLQTISIFKSPFEDEGAMVKRIEDLILGTLFTLASLPLMLFAAIGIKLTSPGPVLFKQSRYGLNGKEIKVWKFRSMRVMENSSVVTQATRSDPRVTRFGAFLRRTSLDELPQFFNVLQGTMSIVGPRPHAVAHNEEYRMLVDNYMVRHKVKPGITGLAQVNGFRGETDTLEKMEQRVHYDLEYIKSWSMYLDLKIVFLTFFRGFVGKNAF